jgi:ActR/RegA family two-component response regulator
MPYRLLLLAADLLTRDQPQSHPYAQSIRTQPGQLETFRFYWTPLQTLQSASGRLRKLLRGRTKVTQEQVSPAHLLIVDDEESIRFSMSEYFSRHGFQVDTAREVEEAEKLLEQTDYKVIIQDLRLGLTRHADGMNIIKLIHRRSPETRIVVLTAYGSAEIEAEARRAGADAFLQKPKPLSQVAQVVQGLIESPRKRVRPFA